MRLAILMVVLMSACGTAADYELSSDLVTYTEAVSFCEDQGGSLVEFNSTAELQVAYDIWASSSVSSEGVWVGIWITNTEGTEYGYVMLRGGALLPVDMTDTRRALALCEFQ